MLGNQTATKGEKSDCSAITPKILSKNTKTMAIQIQTAKLTPMPPRRFMEDTATAMIVRIKTETGKLHFRYKTNLKRPTFEEPLASSLAINCFKSLYILVSAAYITGIKSSASKENSVSLVAS